MNNIIENNNTQGTLIDQNANQDISCSETDDGSQTSSSNILPETNNNVVDSKSDTIGNICANTADINVNDSIPSNESVRMVIIAANEIVNALIGHKTTDEISELSDAPSVYEDVENSELNNSSLLSSLTSDTNSIDELILPPPSEFLDYGNNPSLEEDEFKDQHDNVEFQKKVETDTKSRRHSVIEFLAAVALGPVLTVCSPEIEEDLIKSVVEDGNIVLDPHNLINSILDTVNAEEALELDEKSENVCESNNEDNSIETNKISEVTITKMDDSQTEVEELILTGVKNSEQITVEAIAETTSEDTIEINNKDQTEADLNEEDMIALEALEGITDEKILGCPNLEKTKSLESAKDIVISKELDSEILPNESIELNIEKSIAEPQENTTVATMDALIPLDKINTVIESEEIVEIMVQNQNQSIELTNQVLKENDNLELQNNVIISNESIIINNDESEPVNDNLIEQTVTTESDLLQSVIEQQNEKIVDIKIQNNEQTIDLTASGKPEPDIDLILNESINDKSVDVNEILIEETVPTEKHLLKSVPEQQSQNEKKEIVLPSSELGADINEPVVLHQVDSAIDISVKIDIVENANYEVPKEFSVESKSHDAKPNHNELIKENENKIAAPPPNLQADNILQTNDLEIISVKNTDTEQNVSSTIISETSENKNINISRNKSIEIISKNLINQIQMETIPAIVNEEISNNDEAAEKDETKTYFKTTGEISKDVTIPIENIQSTEIESKKLINTEIKTLDNGNKNNELIITEPQMLKQLQESTEILENMLEKEVLIGITKPVHGSIDSNISPIELENSNINLESLVEKVIIEDIIRTASESVSSEIEVEQAVTEKKTESDNLLVKDELPENNETAVQNSSASGPIKIENVFVSPPIKEMIEIAASVIKDDKNDSEAELISSASDVTLVSASEIMETISNNKLEDIFIEQLAIEFEEISEQTLNDVEENVVPSNVNKILEEPLPNVHTNDETNELDKTEYAASNSVTVSTSIKTIDSELINCEIIVKTIEATVTFEQNMNEIKASIVEETTEKINQNVELNDSIQPIPILQIQKISEETGILSDLVPETTDKKYPTDPHMEILSTLSLEEQETTEKLNLNDSIETVLPLQTQKISEETMPPLQTEKISEEAMPPIQTQKILEEAMPPIQTQKMLEETVIISDLIPETTDNKYLTEPNIETVSTLSLEKQETTEELNQNVQLNDSTQTMPPLQTQKILEEAAIISDLIPETQDNEKTEPHRDIISTISLEEQETTAELNQNVVLTDPIQTMLPLQTQKISEEAAIISDLIPETHIEEEKPNVIIIDELKTDVPIEEPTEICELISSETAKVSLANVATEDNRTEKIHAENLEPVNQEHLQQRPDNLCEPNLVSITNKNENKSTNDNDSETVISKTTVPQILTELENTRNRPTTLELSSSITQQPSTSKLVTPPSFKFLQPKRKIIEPCQILSQSSLNTTTPATPDKIVIEDEIKQSLPSVKALARAFLATSGKIHSKHPIALPVKLKANNISKDEENLQCNEVPNEVTNKIIMEEPKSVPVPVPTSTIKTSIDFFENLK